MLQRLSLSLKLTLAVSLLLPLVMLLMRTLWPDIGWGFLLLFGLQVLMLLMALQLLLTSIWGPGSRWNLPRPSVDSQRRIFVKRDALMAKPRAILHRVQGAMHVLFGRLRKRQAP